MITVLRYATTIAALLAAGCSQPAQEEASPSDTGAGGVYRSALSASAEQNVAGTFRFLVCRSRCAFTDTASAYAVGELVLFSDEPVPALPTSRYAGGAVANGCFRVRKRQDLPDTYLGIDRGSPFRWTREPSGGIRFSLYRSPDAGYPVRAVVVGDSLIGAGTSEGVGIAEISAPDDYIVGRRVGAADPALCSRA